MMPPDHVKPNTVDANTAITKAVRCTGDGALVAGLLPDYVAVAEGVIADSQADLWPEEAAYIANAVEKRRKEFACGRSFVRRCFRALGRPEGPLPASPDRSPRWPEGLVGSITHTDTYCAAAVARTDDIEGIGIDIEEFSRFQPELLRYVLSSGDITTGTLRGLRPSVENYFGAALFSAKETFYKCIYSIAQTHLDFDDVGIEFIDGSDRFYARLLTPVRPFSRGREFTGRYLIVGDRVATAMILPRDGRGSDHQNSPNPADRKVPAGEVGFELSRQRGSDS
jgi:4'-phosphopantetheinyl transferase EntD